MNLLTLCAASLFALLLASVCYADAVDDYLQTQMKKNHIPGVAVAVVQDGKIVKLGSYGAANLEWDAPVGTNTAFQLASATKPFTGIALMKLVEEGKLSLDDRVSKHLPDAPEAWKDVTLLHLATHTSGLPNVFASPRPINTLDEAVQAAIEMPMEYSPGERTAYASGDYAVLMKVMELAAGQPLEEIYRSRIFKPLGMSHSRFDGMSQGGPMRVSKLVPRRAKVYLWEGEEQKNAEFYFAPWAYAAGGLYSSASDLAKLAQALDEGKLLKPGSVKAMWTPIKLNNGTEASYTPGWVSGRYLGHRTVGHSGGPALADILRFPEEKLTVIVLANQQRMYPYLAQGVADYYLSPAPRKEEKGIEDTDPALTQTIRDFLTDLGKGEVNPERFATEAQGPLVPTLKEFAGLWFNSFPPLSSLTLLERREDGDLRHLRYRAQYGKKSLLWQFTVNKEGKIVSLEPITE